MKCPNCGVEIADEHLYCEICGEEIRIVPDFDPEIENHMIEALSTMAVDIEDGKILKPPAPDGKEKEPEGTETPQEKEEEEDTGDKKYRWIVGVGIAVLLLVMAVLVSGYLYRTHSINYQIARAQTYVAQNNYEDAVIFLERAMELEPENVNYAFLTANYYYEMSDYANTEKVLNKVIKDDIFDQDSKEKAYGMLVTVYDEQEKYEMISELISSCKYETIVSQFQHYLAIAPEFNYPGGSYSEVVLLKISSNTAGNIYYTLDGTVPDSESSIYTSPIFLETGDHIVSAIFVNEYGIQSGVTVNEYNIMLSEPDSPEVLLYSGTYKEPTMIEVVPPEEGSVYYTTDGSDPTQDSSRYTEPIPMPLGKSLFKFAVISDEGVSGEVISRNYDFALETDITIDAAIFNVINALVAQDVLEDTSGNVRGMGGKYVYKYQSLIEIPDHGYFYLINEYYEDPTGIQTKSERLYAVHAHTGAPNRLVYDEEGKMGLISLNKE